MRILFVAMAHSIHTARWIGQIADQGWDIHLFPSEESVINPQLERVTVHDYLIRPAGLPASVRLPGAWPWPSRSSASLADRVLWHIRRSDALARWGVAPAQRLARLIRHLKPDIVHSLEIQHAGYLTWEARSLLGGTFPTWIVTNWGSDIYLFGRLSAHAEKIGAVLGACDYYSCECQRDVALGRAFGFRGEVLPVLPNSGGFDLARVQSLRQPGPTSARRLVLLKGYQSWSGRALVGLRALALCADALKGYRVAIYLATPEVELSAALLAQATGIPVEIVPPCAHEEILRLHGRARVSIGLNISDAISTSFLEAFVMGSFPIQSHTSCACEWVEDGVSGLLVPPEDPQEIAAAIRRALSDDALVDRAAQQNARVAAERLDSHTLRPQVIELYRHVAQRGARTADVG